MNQVTPGVQISASELPDTERRRRLASVYRLLIELGQRENDMVDRHADGQEPTGEQTVTNM